MLERQGYFPVTSLHRGKAHVRYLKRKKLQSRRFQILLYCLFQILNPKFPVFRHPETAQAPRWNVSRCRNVYSSVNHDRAGRSPGSLARLTRQPRPVPDTLEGGCKTFTVP